MQIRYDIKILSFAKKFEQFHLLGRVGALIGHQVTNSLYACVPPIFDVFFSLGVIINIIINLVLEFFIYVAV